VHAGDDGNAVRFAELGGADLEVDRLYLGGTKGSVADDAMALLLPVGNQGGFRFNGPKRAPRLVVLYTSGVEADWPDTLDPATGSFTYFGDNREPGNDLHKTQRGGNGILRDTFELAHGSTEDRGQVPVYLLFAKAGRGRDVYFRGVLAPGAAGLTADEDLVAIWRRRAGKRFQNYRSKFTVLDIAKVTRAWIDDIRAGNPLSGNCPEPWRQWVSGRKYQALLSASIAHRNRQDQLPSDQAGRQVLECIHAHFAPRPTDFEHFAAELWKMSDDRVGAYEVTRASVDGGRDAFGDYVIGPASDPLHVTFSLEAKLYAPFKGSVGVGDISRLISRLRHRQFGVLVTTAHVAEQAYKEIREDQHPIVIISGLDIVNLLREKDYSTAVEVGRWLSTAFPSTAPS
jgi:hypothetical protein